MEASPRGAVVSGARAARAQDALGPLCCWYAGLTATPSKLRRACTAAGPLSGRGRWCGGLMGACAAWRLARAALTARGVAGATRNAATSAFACALGRLARQCWCWARAWMLLWLSARLYGERGRAAGAAGARMVARRRTTPRCGQLGMRWRAVRCLGRCRAASTLTGGALARRKAVRWVLWRMDWGGGVRMAGLSRVRLPRRGRGWRRRCVDALGRCAERLSGAMWGGDGRAQRLTRVGRAAHRGIEGWPWRELARAFAAWCWMAGCACLLRGERGASDWKRRRCGWLGWLGSSARAKHVAWRARR
jgi:hypothetical protein